MKIKVWQAIFISILSILVVVEVMMLLFARCRYV